ncbi:ectopic P granules protein 5 homolog [Diadema antillarum]|uniref:ectopic P granules protein 5 homolog n=1 Tax=Diadema antillarum TaxID=105358 RepID=UPI003A86698D
MMAEAVRPKKRTKKKASKIKTVAATPLDESPLDSKIGLTADQEQRDAEQDVGATERELKADASVVSQAEGETVPAARTEVGEQKESSQTADKDVNADDVADSEPHTTHEGTTPELEADDDDGRTSVKAKGGESGDVEKPPGEYCSGDIKDSGGSLDVKVCDREEEEEEEFQEASESLVGVEGCETAAGDTREEVAVPVEGSMTAESETNVREVVEDRLQEEQGVGHSGTLCASDGEAVSADAAPEEPVDANHDGAVSAAEELTDKDGQFEELVPEGEEGPKSLGGQSLEEFEVLSLSRENSVDQSGSSAGQATAPPVEDDITSGASAPPIEATPLASVTEEQREQMSSEDTVAKVTGTAPLIPVSAEEDPLSAVAAGEQTREEEPSQAEETRVAVKRAEPRLISGWLRTGMWPPESMQPMSRLELRYYYSNSMLATQDAFVESFVKGNYVDKHEFYELVNNYLRARLNVGTIKAEIAGFREVYTRSQDEIWSFRETEVPVKGQCQDDINVKATHTFTTVEYQEDKMHALEHALDKLREHIHGTYALVTYTAQLSRLQIECYIHQLLNCSHLFRGISSSMPITAHLTDVHSSTAQADIARLKQCISVLFAFQRKPVSDLEFVELSRSWLQRMVSVLLQVATLEDHLFIFNHLLRCPPGIGDWAAAFLQVASPPSVRESGQETQLLHMENAATSSGTGGQRSQGFVASHLLDHFVVMLSTLMSPVRYREEYLAKMTVLSASPSSANSDATINWTLVDEDVDAEDEESSHSLLLNEGDLVELLAQFPFTEMFSHILRVDSTADRAYSIEQVESQDMLRLVAFSSTLIDIFRSGLGTFNRSRYRQFVKRIGRLIRHTVQYVANQWTNYHSWRAEVCGDAEDATLPSDDPEKAISLQQIQLEVDEMFFRAVQCIMSSPRLGTWQFLADMPYSCLSPHMMWRLLWFLHHSSKGELKSSSSINASRRAQLEEYKWDLSDAAKKEMFSSKLLNMPMSEVIYLLTTFANMASARSKEEADFVEFITTEVYELAYLNKHTRDSCSKVGRELLAGMALTHPFILTNIIGLIQSSMDIIGSMSLYLCSELPLHLWQLSQSDMSVLRAWLLENSADSNESQLARLILSKLNWGFNEQEDELVLDIDLHRKVAILVMEAFSKHIMERQQGAFIASTLSWGISIVLGDVVQLDVWCWDILNKLRLHTQDQPIPVLPAAGAVGGASSGQSLSKSSKSAEGQGFLQDEEGRREGEFCPPDLKSDPLLYPVNKALESKTPLACYIAVAMTKAGHDVENFLSKGLEYLQNLVTSGCHRMCIPLIGKVVPTFINAGHQEYLLTNVKFISMIETILNGDQQYSRLLQKLSMSFQTKCTALFSSMIATLLRASKAPGAPPGSTEALLEFWLTVLTSCKNWHTNYDICQVLDTTLEAALVCCKASSVLTQEVFLMHFRKKVSSTKAPSLLSSVMSLVTSASPLPSMQEQYKKDFPWLAYSFMLAETQFLQESGALQAVSQELHGNPSMTTDQAVKKVSQKTKNSFLVNVNQLPIYRWAQLALDTNIHHPLLPVIWQKFFSLYLERMNMGGRTLERYSIGLRYFHSFADLAFMKQLKRQLSRSADAHHNASQGRYPEGQRPHRQSQRAAMMDQEAPSWDGGSELEQSYSEREEFDNRQDREFQTKLLKLYQTYGLWLEEPLLHDASLYLPSLPEQYDGEKLARIFNGDLEPWMEYVDWDEVNFGVDRLVTQWLQVTKPPTYKNMGTNHGEQEIEATSQILSRLSQYDTPKPPPAVPELVAPVGDIAEHLMVDHQAMALFIEEDLKDMLEYANSFATRESYNVALDLSYVELLPTLYHNSEVETRLEIPCKAGIVSRHRHQCAGPARIAVRHKAFKLSDAVKRKLDENRAEYKQLTIEIEATPPPVICCAAVHLENAITNLINFSRAASDGEREASKQVGVAFLYHLANRMNDDCRHYPPTRQFFTSCIEILGQEFVRPYPEQAQPLLHEILTNHKLAGILAPNFVPCNCPETFVHMYTEVVRATGNDMQDLAFMLLTKFDITQWLERHRPTPSSGSQLIAVIGEALMACGLGGEEPDGRPLPHFEVYRSHLRAMFLHCFPQHYADVLHVVMKGMEEKKLRLVVLQDVLKALCCPLLPDFGDIGQKQVEKLVQEETYLSLNELRDSLDWLGRYFSRQRHERAELKQYGLYSHWKDYMPTLSSFLGFLALNCVLQEAKRLQEMGTPIDQGIKALWELIVSFFSPWVAWTEVPSPSKPNTSQIIPAWSEGDADPALVMVTLFTETTSFMQALFYNAQITTSANILTLFWSYYSQCMARKELRFREDVMYAYHRAMASLPWNEFYPDVYCMESMIKMYEDGQNSCLLFLASIFPRIQWPAIMERLIAGGDVQQTNQHLSALLSMLIIFGNSDEIASIQGPSLKVLIAESHQLPWYLLDDSCYHSATMWQLKKSNPRLVLEEQSVSTVLSLMRSVAGVGSTEPPNPRLAAKQTAYVGLVVGLMCQCSQDRQVKAEQFTLPLHGLLRDVTLISSLAPPSVDASAHLCSLLTTVLSLLNGCSPVAGAPDSIVHSLVKWLADCSNGGFVLQVMAVACNTLASTKHMALITEACVDSYFNTATPAPSDSSCGWAAVVAVLKIPQLSHDEFLAQCLEGGAFLTLYAYLSQKLPQCRSLEEETALQAKMIEWCINCKPSRENEFKLLLWWYKALELSTRMINFGTPEWSVARTLNNLAPAIQALGEDRRTSGILGALGFGKQSQLSFRFRIAARSMATFIMAQLPKEGMRMVANAPGAITYPSLPRPSRSGSSNAHQGMKLLDSALENRSYQELRGVTEYVRQFILDGHHCLPDSLALLSYLTAHLYPEKTCLNVVHKRNANATVT